MLEKKFSCKSNFIDVYYNCKELLSKFDYKEKEDGYSLPLKSSLCDFIYIYIYNIIITSIKLTMYFSRVTEIKEIKDTSD